MSEQSESELKPLPRPTTRPLLIEEPVKRIVPKSEFLIRLEADQAHRVAAALIRARAESVPENVVALRARRPPINK